MYEPSESAALTGWGYIVKKLLPPACDYPNGINCMACAHTCPKIAVKLICIKEPNPLTIVGGVIVYLGQPPDRYYWSHI